MEAIDCLLLASVRYRCASPAHSMSTTLRLALYDPGWPGRFAAEAEQLRAGIGSRALAIEHVGSTAVPGLAGKPAPAWCEKLAFREALRADRALERAYAAEKWRVAEAAGWDKGAYR